MVLAYIAHPIGGDVEVNLADLRRIVRKINLEFPNVVPFVPYYSDVVSLNDDVAEERERGLKNDMEILERKIPDEVWLTGSKISYGMNMEKSTAERLGIPVIDFINAF